MRRLGINSSELCLKFYVPFIAVLKIENTLKMHPF